jgi:hypothetical protein
MSLLTNTFIDFDTVSSAITFNVATGSDYFVPDNADDRVYLIIKNSNSQNGTVTLKAGDGMLAPLGDVTVSVGGNQTVFVPLCRAETARVKVTSGTNKGDVFVTTSVETGGSLNNVSICVVSVE